MEQSDTPRVDAAAKRGSDLGGANTMWSGIWPLARDLERELATATRERDEWKLAARTEAQIVTTIARERDEAIALNVEWAKRAATWLATPEAAQRLQGYRDLGQQVAAAQNERDEARAALRAIKLEAASLADAQVIALEALAATEPKP